MWVGDMLSTNTIVSQPRLVIATRCLRVCADQQSGLWDLEGSTEDWVEETNMRRE